MDSTNRTVPREYDDDVLPCWHSQTSPVSDTSRAECLLHPDRIIPIVFVPGIMGSNLKAKDPNLSNGIKNIWRPDSASCAIRIIKQGPAGRQAIFNPSNAIVDNALAVEGKRLVRVENGFGEKLLTARGWGTVYWNSYGPFLEYLEHELNEIMLWDSHRGSAEITSSWSAFHDGGNLIHTEGKEHLLKLSTSELTNVAKYWYPVHAVGYNWLQSNEQSGKDLAAEIDRILASYKVKWGSKAVKKVILVTHSMGGLVARAAVHPSIGNAQDKVLGILHGAMPALGAPAAYKRMRAGNETGGISPTKLATWLFLGAYGPDVTPVLAQSPGGLQLLPNQTYPSGWLTIKINDTIYKVDGEPYDKIYQEKDKWWRLVNPAWLDPINSSASSAHTDGPNANGLADKAWERYKFCLSSAQDFHKNLGNRYHPTTYSFYGSDPAHHSWGKIEWDIGTLRYAMRGPFSVFDSQQELKALALDGKPTSDDGAGTVEAKASHASWMGDITDRFQLQDATTPGDGTVPQESGLAPGKVGGSIEQFGLTGFDHQSAYLPSMTEVMAVSKYAIAKIAQSADWADS